LQRKQLQILAKQHGLDLPDGVHFDPSGNVNEQHGFAGLPTWAKIASIAAPVAAADIFTGGAVHGAIQGPLMHALGMGAGSGGGTAAGGSIWSGALPALPGAAAGSTSAAAPSVMGSIAAALKNPSNLLSAGGRMLGAAGDASAHNRGAVVDATMQHDRLGLEADAQRRAAESDAMRKSMWGQMAAGYQPSTRPAGIPTGTPGGYITPQARELGQGITNTAVDRMQRKDYPSITPLSQLPMKPGIFEQIANYAGPALSLFDPRMYGQNGQQPDAH
jgi:hypothetical protein